MKLLKLFLTYQRTASQSRNKTRGFTLIELLLGLILAFLIITPLLGFMIDIMNTDRQEQAKANSEQEIQAALDYIARDLDQAIFIYDGYGLSANTQVVQNLPTYNNAVPVLVFWKRYFHPKVIPTGNGQNDTFVYSLVAYYLVDNTGCIDQNWSCTARIGRVEIRDGVNNANPRIDPDPGFELFNINGTGTIEDLMNAWPPTRRAYNPAPPMQILVDYIDQTPPPPPGGTGGNGVPQASCPTNARSVPRTGQPPNATQYIDRLVPRSAQPKSSFYACVDSDATTAQVFIRGNALARISPRRQAPRYSTSKLTYFPQGNIRVKGGGLLTNTQS